jgi:signal transduction histidine kinase/CheY-like chemotaxis protein
VSRPGVGRPKAEVVTSRSVNIRRHLFLLVLAVWLPAAVGFGLLAASTYQREEARARDSIEQLVLSVHRLVEGEITQRVVMARALALSSDAREARIQAFHQGAQATLQGSPDWAFLVNRSHVLATTQLPSVQAPIPRPDRAPFLLDGAPQVAFLRVGPAPGRPVIGVLEAVPQSGGARLNVGVGFAPQVLQAVLAQQHFPPDSVAAVLDSELRIVARNRDPAKYLGVPATPDLRSRVAAGQNGFYELKTQEGTPTLAYLSQRNAYGWVTVVGLPRSQLVRAAQLLTAQAVAASAALLFISLLLATLVTRRISGPVLALAHSAAALSNDEVPPPLVTGLTEVDTVGAALHAAGQRSHDAARQLEGQVRAAVQRAEQAQALLLESQKHEAIGRLTGGLAHDFNNLLQTISTALSVLDRSTPPGPAERRVLQSAQRACGRAADLVRQMLTFGRAQPLQPTHVDLRDLLLQTQELTGKAVGERIDVAASLDAQLPMLYVDPVQLELALLNLVFNARDALPEGGHIRIDARPAQAHEVSHLPAEQGPYVCLQVSDDGAGMDEATRLKAFEPYFTTKPSGAGSGLGLSQVHAFARQSGGDAAIDSRPGQGTSVRLFLPASGTAAAVPQDIVPAQADLRGLRVLMAEDDVLVVPSLEAFGHVVTLVHSADDAVPLLEAEPAAFDVLFTDVVMPGRMNGLDLVTWCAQHRPRLAVVVATGYSAQLVDLPVRVLRKPYGLDELLEALQRAAAEALARA